MSAEQATQAQSQAVLITTTNLASKINEVSVGMGKQSSVPTASVASVQTPEVAPASAQYSDSSSDGSGDTDLWVFVGAGAAGVIVIAIAVALLVRQCSQQKPASDNEQKVGHVELDEIGAASL